MTDKEQRAKIIALLEAGVNCLERIAECLERNEFHATCEDLGVRPHPPTFEPIRGDVIETTIAPAGAGGKKRKRRG